jgi:hypothetical protein
MFPKKPRRVIIMKEGKKNAVNSTQYVRYRENIKLLSRFGIPILNNNNN